MEEFMMLIVVIIIRAVMQGTTLLFGATGEILTEKSGNLNLGIPGIMYVGAISGVIGGFAYESSTSQVNVFLAVVIPLLSCLAGSLIVTLIYAFLTITLRANQNVTGLALTTFGVGLGNFFGGSLIKITNSTTPFLALPKVSAVFCKTLPFVNDLKGLGDKLGVFGKIVGWIGEIIFSYGFMVYLAIVIAIVASYVLKRTRVGLQLRAVGESPATADAAGINVNKYKYFATCAGGMIAGLGGLYYIMDKFKGIWANDAFGDLGWLAIAIVIFAIWRPNVSILGSYIFGGLYILFNYVSVSMNLLPLMQMLPYVVTIIVLVIVSMRKKRENQPPESLGLNYFREER